MSNVYLFDGKPQSIEKSIAKHYIGGGGQPPMEERISHIEMRLDSLERSVDMVKSDVSHIKTQISSLESDVSNMRWWILGTCITTILSVAGIMIAFAQYQSSWFQVALSRNWEVSQKSLEKIEATQMRLERIDALREAGLLKFQREEQNKQPDSNAILDPHSNKK